jgi:hypothetical protein
VAPLVTVIGDGMRRRTLLVALAGLAVVIAAGVVVVWQRPLSRITRENCDRIRLGMTRAEVEAILGPPDDYRTGHGESDFGDDSASRWVGDPPGFQHWGLGWFAYPNFQPVEGVPTTGMQANWFGDSCRICVVVDDAGRVRDSRVYNRRLTQGPLDNLLWRLKRQWRRWFPE